MKDMKLLDELISIDDDLKCLLCKLLHKKDLTSSEILYITHLIKVYHIYRIDFED